MPEVVYPSPDAEGNPRDWVQVFPIYRNDDQNTEWRIINDVLEAIAMNNRFGDKTPEQLKEHLRKVQHDYFVEELAKLEGEPHDHKEEFPTILGEDGEETEWGHSSMGCTQRCVLPEDRQKLIDERARKFRFYGEWMYYIEMVFANLGGAYREFKS